MERVEVRIRRILGPGGDATVSHTVYCPIRKESRLLVDCETCERCTEMTADGSCVICEVPPAAVSSGALVRVTHRLLPTLLSHTPISEVMTRDVFCVTSEMSVEAISELLLDRGFSGVPVVDKKGYPIGVVSKTDLLRERTEGGNLDTTEPPDLDDGFHVETLARATAADVMMPVAYTLEETSMLGDAIRLMKTEKIHRLPVVDASGRVAGVLSTMDILRWLDS